MIHPGLILVLFGTAAAIASKWGRSLGAGSSGGPAGYVGIPGYAWPNREAFPTEASFGEELSDLGYGPGDWTRSGWSIMGPQGIAAVQRFQADYTLVEAASRMQHWEVWDGRQWRPLAAGDLALQPSGFIDARTITALIRAMLYSEALQMEWTAVVQSALQDAEQTQS